MEFEYWVPENARLRARISQRSNLKYVHRVVENFEDRQKHDFRESSLGFLANAPDIQFSAQLIQQLVFRTVRTEKTRELWFNLQGHLCRFGLQEYALVTGLRCSEPPHDDHYREVIAKKRLKEKYFKWLERISCAQLEKAFLKPSTPRSDRYKLGLAIIVEGVFNALDNNVGVDEFTLSIVDDLDVFFAYPWGRVGFQRLLKGWRGEWARKFCDAKRKNEKEITYTIHGFPIAIQVWTFEAVPEIGDRFGQRIGDRAPRLLNWTATKQTQQRTYDKFFRKVKFHVYAILRPTDNERLQPYISTLSPFEDRAVPTLDNIASSIVGPQFDADAELVGGDNNAHTSDVDTEKSNSDSANENSNADDQPAAPAGDRDEEGTDSGTEGESSEEESASEEARHGFTGAFSAEYIPIRTVSPNRGPSTSRPGASHFELLTKSDVEGMLYDERVLLEMRMRTHTLEIMQHVTSEFDKFRDFISARLAAPVSTPAPAQPDVPIQPVHAASVTQDVGEERAQVDRSQATYEAALDTEEAAVSGRRSDGSHTESDSSQDNAELHDTEVGEQEPDTESLALQECLPTVDGRQDEGEAIGIQEQRAVTELGTDIALPTLQRRSARLRRPAASTRTPYTRGRGKRTKKR